MTQTMRPPFLCMNLKRKVGALVLSGLAFGCGAEAGAPADPTGVEVAREALSGTVTFVETAKAPLASGAALNFTSKKRVRALAVQGNFVYVGGDFTITTSAGTVTNLAKFQIPSSPSSPLTLVTSFRPTVNKPVWAIATSATKVYVGGEFTQINSTARNGLALLDPTTGAVNTTFAASVGSASNYVCSGCGDPPNFAWGVHAIALTNWGRTGEPSEVVVGGNFTTIDGTSRLGLASVNATTGSVTTSYTTGVVNGFVHTLKPLFGDMYVGGNFSQTTDGGWHPGLFETDFAGALYDVSFPAVGSFAVSLDIDWNNFRLIVGSGAANQVQSYFTGGGDPIWTSGWFPQGDVQAVTWFDGNVYFGFHDGLVTDGNGAGVAGDQYKLAAVAGDTGLPLTDKTHTGACAWDTTVDNCWAPNNDSAGKTFATGTGAWGIWGLATYSSSSGSRLIVGGEVQRWGSVSSPLLTTFGSQ
jgi:hypothetical protein